MACEKANLITGSTYLARCFVNYDKKEWTCPPLCALHLFSSVYLAFKTVWRMKGKITPYNPRIHTSTKRSLYTEHL